jgi:hypothetical protein
MFRFAFVVLAAIGLGVLLFGGVGWASAGFGFLLLAPLFIFLKIVLFMVLLGAVCSLASSRRYSAWRSWGRRPRRPTTRPEGPSDKERFEEWHRMQHARDEVDSWVDPEL